MNELASLWIGESLGEIELASIYSFLRHGNPFTLYSYAPIQNVPPGVEFRDASEILPTEQIIRYRNNNNPSLHSNLFRYALVAKTNQIWVDLDIVALKPFNFGSAYVIGFENINSVGSSVLRLPKDSPTLRALLELKPDTIGFPPHFKGFRKWKYWLRSFGQGLPVDRWPWGTTGPRQSRIICI
jgi:hypothetical protein